MATMASLFKAALHLVTIATMLTPTVLGDCSFESHGKTYCSLPCSVTLTCTNTIFLSQNNYDNMNTISDCGNRGGNRYYYSGQYNQYDSNIYKCDFDIELRDSNAHLDFQSDGENALRNLKLKLKSVDTSFNNLTSIPPIIFDFENLRDFNISHNNLVSITFNDFQKIPSLFNLDMSHNALSFLYSEIEGDVPISYFTHLVTLNLAHNRIQVIPDNVFQNFNNLEKLDLSHNQISVIDSSTFELSAIMYLDISYNSISNLNLALMRFNTLTELYLNNNKLIDIQRYDFAGYKKLTTLALNYNSLSNIAPDSFSSMKSLHALTLSHNQIDKISKALFSNNKKITILDLSYNNIKTIERDAFRNNSNIQILAIDGNHLQGSLSKGTLEGLTQIKTLNISHHNLSRIDNFAFLGITNLSLLNISHNVLSVVSRSAFKTLQNLKTLDLSNNILTDITFDTSDLNMLSWISLKNNNITTVPSVLKELVSLEYLDISENSLTHLVSDSFGSLQNLKHLYLASNPLSGDIEENSFQSLESLPLLDLSQTHISSINNNSFFGMNALLNFNISYSNLSNIEYNSFDGMENLEILDASHNSLTFFLVNNSQIINVEELILSHNSITRIDSVTFANLYSLQRLHLSNNKITLVEMQSFNTLHNLEYLDLSFNEEASLNSSCFNNLHLMKYLSLSGHKPLEFSKTIGFNLERLTFTTAHITNVESLDLFNITTLQILDLSFNDISQIDKKSFHGLNLLETLSLHTNKLSSIQPGSFKDTQGLANLNLSHNELTSLGYGIFLGLRNLHTLDLSYNKIRQIEAQQLYNTPSLRYLIIDGNYIKNLNLNEFDSSHVSTISLGDNPLHCKLLINYFRATRNHRVIEDSSSETLPFETIPTPYNTFRNFPLFLTAVSLNHSRHNVDGITCESELPAFSNSFDNFNISSTNIVYNNEITNHLLEDIKTILSSSKFSINGTQSFLHSDDLSKPVIRNLTTLTEKLIERINATMNRDVKEKSDDIQTKIYNEIRKENSQVNDVLKYLYEMSARTNNTMTARRGFEKEETSTASPVAASAADYAAAVERFKEELKQLVAEIKVHLTGSIRANEVAVGTRNSSSDDAELRMREESSAPATHSRDTKFTEVCVGITLAIVLGCLAFKVYQSKKLFPKIRSPSTQGISSTIEM